MVTEAERELVRSGKFDQLVEQQRRIDAERDAEVMCHVHLDDYPGSIVVLWVMCIILQYYCTPYS